VDTGLVVPFGRYVLKERLAQGGMGEVFRAVAVGEHGFEKPVVVKRVLPAHAGREDLTELFVAEAKLMTRLAHPNIVEVLDFGRGEHKDYYLVLELVDGVDLGRLLRAFGARDERFPVPLALFIASQVLRGLHHAHTKSAGQGSAGQGGVIVHRDVSPSNVLCSTEGEVKVADFGVALVTQVEKDGEGGGRGGVAGKPGYMAPEQFDGGAVDPRADVFSAGVVLHQMLTGELPFGGASVEAQQEAARRGERAPASGRRDDVSPAIEAVLARAMAPQASARFPDAKAMAQAIEVLRDAGQRIAHGDDLAEAVLRAQRDLPAAGRRVIALTGSSSAPASDDAPHELTRTGAPGAVGAFTLRFPVRADATTRQHEPDADPTARPADRWNAPEPRTERIAADDLASGPLPSHGSEPFVFPVEPGTGSGSVPEPVERAEPPPSADAPVEGPRQRAIRRGALAAVAAAALLALVAFAVRPGPGAGAQAPSPPSSILPAATPPPEASAAGAVLSATPVSTVTPAPRSSTRVPPTRLTTSSPAGPPAATAPTGLPAPAAEPLKSAAPVEDCAGDVAFFSDGAWTIRGGPQPVQSPSPSVVWPCGTYALVATSRLDATSKTRTITVGPKRRTVVDLR
jgi:serine/threonine-protein kinase